VRKHTQKVVISSTSVLDPADTPTQTLPFLLLTFAVFPAPSLLRFCQCYATCSPEHCDLTIAGGCHNLRKAKLPTWRQKVGERRRKQPRELLLLNFWTSSGPLVHWRTSRVQNQARQGRTPEIRIQGYRILGKETGATWGSPKRILFKGAAPEAQ
jgi:hypothetical protein